MDSRLGVCASRDLVTTALASASARLRGAAEIANTQAASRAQ